MFPEKHLKDLESSRRRKKLLDTLVISSAFLSTFFILGPLLHELSHILVLELKNCSYLFDFSVGFPSGFHATTEPLCSISPGQLIVFYSSGYVVTLLVGTAMNILSSRYREPYHILSALGTGTLLSAILTIGVKGDIQNALKAAGFSTSYGMWIALIIFLGVLGASIHGIEMLLELEREE